MGDIWNIKEQYKRQMGSLWSRGDRGIVMGGDQTPAKVNVIDYITQSGFPLKNYNQPNLFLA